MHTMYSCSQWLCHHCGLAIHNDNLLKTLTYMKTTTNQLHTNTPDNLQGKILAWEAEWEPAKIIIM